MTILQVYVHLPAGSNLQQQDEKMRREIEKEAGQTNVTWMRHDDIIYYYPRHSSNTNRYL